MRELIVLVVGTGTDVGKTHVTAALLARATAARSGARAAAWKPIATGVSEPEGSGEDALRLQALAPPLHAFVPPVSPHLAARAAGATIDSAVIGAAARAHAKGLDVLFVESAGGLFSPLSDTQTMIDLAHAFEGEVRVLLVAPDRIGVLHDVGATMRAARAEGIALPVVALSAPEVPDASTGTNAAELVGLALTRSAIVFPRATPTSDASARAAEECLVALGIEL